MPPLAQSVLWRVPSKLMQPLGLPWLPNSDTQVFESCFSALKPLGLVGWEEFWRPTHCHEPLICLRMKSPELSTGVKAQI